MTCSFDVIDVQRDYIPILSNITWAQVTLTPKLA